MAVRNLRPMFMFPFHVKIVDLYDLKFKMNKYIRQRWDFYVHRREKSFKILLHAAGKSRKNPSIVEATAR